MYLKKNKETSSKTYHTLKGMHDILPEEQKFWDFVFKKVRCTVLDYGFQKIETPILEMTDLFVRSVGDSTDIIGKEMYSFIDKDESKISLRPEATASIARAYIEHGMLNLPQPVKLWYWGPMFRHERPQAGRTRQLWQFGFEVLGEKHPVIDAQLILLAYNLYKDLGIPVIFPINSIGCTICRPEYIEALNEFLKARKNMLCEVCQKRLITNTLRTLDCKEQKCQALLEEAPQIVDWLCEGCRGHFVLVLEFLDELDIPYILNSRLVRGLDYYTKTTFEIWPEVPEGEEEEKRGQNALGGGGRYDDLIQSLGGRDTPAAGFACGIERTILKMREKDILVPEKPKPKIFLAQLGPEARKKCLKLYEDLRKEGFQLTESFSKDDLSGQLETASRLQAKFTLILGQKEFLDQTIIIRDMESGIQEIVDLNKLIPELKKRLEKEASNLITKKLK